MTRTTTWALIADRAAAKILSLGGRTTPLELVAELTHPAGALHERELRSDAPGRSFSSGNDARHALERREAPHEHEARDFARRLAEALRAGRTAHRYDRLILAAEPKFLGLLRDALDPATHRLVSREIPKHLLGEGDGSLEEQLRLA